jgi:putative membrane protein
MRRTAQKIVALMLPMLPLSACGGGEQPRAQAAPRAPLQYQPARAAAVATPSARTYFATASSIELFEILSSELALQRSANARVRDFASRMIQSHKGTSSQLSLAGRRLNLLPSATLSPTYQTELDQLRAAADFDSTYKRQQIALHRQAISLHRNYAARGASPTLRPVAQAILPVYQRHMQLLRYL